MPNPEGYAPPPPETINAEVEFQRRAETAEGLLKALLEESQRLVAALEQFGPAEMDSRASGAVRDMKGLIQGIGYEQAKPPLTDAEREDKKSYQDAKDGGRLPEVFGKSL